METRRDPFLSVGLKHSPDEKGIGFGNAERGTRNLECEKRKWEVKNEKGRFDRTN